MVVKEKISKWREWVNTTILVLTLLLLVFAGYKGAIMWGEYTAQQAHDKEQLMFDSSAQKNNHINHVNEPYSRYKMLMLRDTLVDQGQHLDTIQKDLMGAFDTINKFWLSEAEDRANRIPSRKKRDSLDLIQTQQMQDFGKQFDIQKGINLQILDELKEIRKHHND